MARVAIFILLNNSHHYTLIEECSVTYVLSRAINFGRQCHFKIWLDCHKFKKFPSLPMSTKCQKMRKKITINVIQYDDKL
jgi:hypothetical protein